MTNRLQLVDREHIWGTIDGAVNFGFHVSCIARSPTAALLWSSGTPYVSGRVTCYSESGFIGILHRRPNWSLHPAYESFGSRGGRLNIDRVKEITVDIVKLFDDEDIPTHLIEAVKTRKTLLIEGGGRVFPARYRPEIRLYNSAIAED